MGEQLHPWMLAMVRPLSLKVLADPMLDELRRWERVSVHGGVALIDPIHPRTIRILTSLPPQPFDTLVAALRASAPAPLRDAQQSGPADEIAGDAQLVTLASSGDPDRIWIIAALTCNDGQTLIDAVGDADLRPLVGHLVRTLRRGLTVESRRFAYDPPPGWYEEEQRDRTIWLHPEHPARITVFPARPFTNSPAERLYRHLTMRATSEVITDTPEVVGDAINNHGLVGRTRTTTGMTACGASIVVVTAALTDDQFAYLALLEALDVDHRDDVTMFERVVVASFKPLAYANTSQDIAGMWID